MPKKATPLLPDPGHARTQILHAALELFTTQGYSLTTTRLITEKAEVSKGMIYHYFSSKEAVLLEVLQNRSIAVGKELQKLAALPDAAKALRELTRQYFDMVKKSPDYFRFRMALMLQPDIPAAIKNFIRLRTQEMFEIIVDLFRRAGSSAPRKDAQVFMATLDGAISHWLSVFPALKTEEIKKQLFLLIPSTSANPRSHGKK